MSVPAPLRMRPLEVGDLLDETFRLYRRHFLLFGGISVLLALPSAGLFGLALGYMGSTLNRYSTGPTAPTQPPDFSFLGPVFVGLGVAFLVNLLILPFSMGAVMYAASESALGRPVTAGGIVRGVLHRYFSLLGYWALFYVSFVVAFVLCVVPLVLWTWVFVGWIVAVPAMFVENIGLGAALARSWHLVKLRWWRTFLVLFLISIVWYVAGLALAAFVQLGQVLLLIVLSPFIAQAITTAVAQVVSALVTPIIQIALVLIYFDLRVRKEGLDLFQMAYQMAPPPPAPV